ncbi:MAG: Gfo/Idh/MocA family oxidoreductase, partial [Promethearchaeota archaeon]
MSDDVYNFVVCGLGHISDNWLPSFQDQSKMFGDKRRVDIIAFVDPDKSTWVKAKKYGFDNVPCYVRLEDVFKEEESDAVLILTPPQYHLRYIWESVYECNHVLTEKPFVTSRNQLKHAIKLFDIMKEEEL